jgi:hypothetical protein
LARTNFKVLLARIAGLGRSGLADMVGFDARFNKAIYEIARREFEKPDYQPMEVAAL